MKKIIWTALIAAGFAGHAHAADIAARPYTKAPVAVAPIYDWSGFYIGGNVGGQWLDSDASFVYPFQGVSGAAGLRSTSVIGGGQIGYNWQFSPSWLLGLEADISYADHNDGATLLQQGNDYFASNAKLTTQGAVRGRLGYIAGQWLFYGTGGVAFGQAETTSTLGRVGVGELSVTSSETKVGWTAGAGVEYMFAPNWIAGVEYRYTDLGNLDSNIGPGAFPANHQNVFGTADYRTNDVRFRLSYKFGGLGARY